MNAEKSASVILSKWYKPETMYVATFEANLSEDGRVTGGVGRYIANPDLHGAFREPPYIDTVTHLDDVRTTTTLTVREAHMQGHPWAFPGHKIVRAMGECVYQNYARRPAAQRLSLIGFESVAFRQMIACGSSFEMTSVLKQSQSGIVEADIEAILNGKTAALVRGARFLEVSRFPGSNNILADQLMEGAAQIVIIVSGKTAENVDPLFMGIGKADFSDLPKTGETVLYHVSNLRGSGFMFAADVRITIEDIVGERESANFIRLSGLIAKRKE